MLLNILRQLNWVDILVIFIFLRVIYVAAKNGFIIELFKFIGILFTIYISFHYYTTVADIFRQKVSLDWFPLEFLDFMVFTVLAGLTYAVFILFRSISCHFIKMEAVPSLSRWGGFILGIFRACLCSSLLVYAMSISSTSYLNLSAKKSYSAKRIFSWSVNAYSGIWNGFMSKFMQQEKFNKTVLENQSAFFAAAKQAAKE